MPPKFNPKTYSRDQLPGIYQELKTMLTQVEQQMSINKVLSNIEKHGYHLEFAHQHLGNGFSGNEIYSSQLDESYPGWNEFDLFYHITLSSYDKHAHRGIDIDLMPHSQEEWVTRLNFKVSEPLDYLTKTYLKELGDYADWEDGCDHDSPDIFEGKAIVWLVYPNRTNVPGPKFQVLNSKGEILKLEIKDGKLCYQDSETPVIWSKDWFIIP